MKFIKLFIGLCMKLHDKTSYLLKTFSWFNFVFYLGATSFITYETAVKKPVIYDKY